MRIGPAGTRRSYTNNGVPCWTHKISTDIRPLLPPFYRGAKCPNFWPKFRPRSSLDRRIFELRRFIRKQKQTCQGSMIGLPSYQTWGRWVPQLPKPLAQWVPPKVKVENFLYILHSSGPHNAGARQYYTNSGAPGWTDKISTDIKHMLPPFLQGAKFRKFWPKFRPQWSSDRHIFELERFIGKQKQICHAQMGTNWRNGYPKG